MGKVLGRSVGPVGRHLFAQGLKHHHMARALHPTLGDSHKMRANTDSARRSTLTTTLATGHAGG